MKGNRSSLDIYINEEKKRQIADFHPSKLQYFEHDSALTLSNILLLSKYYRRIRREKRMPFEDTIDKNKR